MTNFINMKGYLMLKMIVLIFGFSFIFTGCFSNEYYYEVLKDKQKVKEGKYPKENGLVPQQKKDQSYKQYVDEIEKSKF